MQSMQEDNTQRRASNRIIGDVQNEIYPAVLSCQVCANAFERARTEANVINSVDDVDGMNTISATDQRTINLMVTELKAKREQVPKKTIQTKTKPMTPIQESPNSRLNRLKSSSTPSLGIMYTNADQLTTLKMVELRKTVERKNL